MKLLLCSSGMFVTQGNHNFFDKPLNEVNLAYIITASKGIDDLSYIEYRIQDFKNKGVNYQEIDIEGKSLEELKEAFKDKDAIYIEGGNTFYLLKAMKESGADKLIKQLILDGMLYIGSSAGSYVACPSIEMTNWKIDTKSTYGLTDFSAMNLVPFLMTVHYTPERKEILKPYIQNSNYEVKILTDQQALFVENNKITLIGEGEEIRI